MRMTLTMPASISNKSTPNDHQSTAFVYGRYMTICIITTEITMSFQHAAAISTHTRTRTRTHTRLTALFPGLPGRAGTRKVKPRDSEWQWHQLGHMHVCTSLQTDNHASTSPLIFYRPDAFLSPNQQHQSTEGMMQRLSATVNKLKSEQE